MRARATWLVAVLTTATVPRRETSRMLSLYFNKDTPEVTLDGVIEHMFSAWYLFPIGVIAYVSWGAAEQLDSEHPFRGFLIPCAVIFFMSFMGSHGMTTMEDPDGSSVTVFDAEAAQRAKDTGRFFGQFLVYVAVSYSAMLWKLRRRAQGV